MRVDVGLLVGGGVDVPIFGWRHDEPAEEEGSKAAREHVAGTDAEAHHEADSELKLCVSNILITVPKS